MLSTGRNNQSHRGRGAGVYIVAALALPLLLVAGGAVAGTKLTRDDRRTVDVDGQTRIVVRNDRGQTVVVGKDDASRVTIVARFLLRAGSDDEANELMKQFTFDVTEGDTDIVIETQRPEKKRIRRSLWSVIRGSGADMLVDYTIEVPRPFSVGAWSTSGDVRISNVTGAAEVHATSGNVYIREVGAARVELTSGAVQAEKVDGDVRVLASSGAASVDGVKGTFVMQATSGGVSARRVGGDCQVQVITGDLDLDGCLGDVRFQTSTGNARIWDVQGSISAITSSGDMDVMIVPVGEKDFVLSSSSGDINVYFPPRKNYGFLLDIATGTGAIEGDLAIKVDEINRRRLKGVVGKGDALSRLTIETASGDVTIAEKPARDRR
jgi:DUF4097 and DUF4098 domain-containing protein YvlB